MRSSLPGPVCLKARSAFLLKNMSITNLYELNTKTRAAGVSARNRASSVTMRNSAAAGNVAGSAKFGDILEKVLLDEKSESAALQNTQLSEGSSSASRASVAGSASALNSLMLAKAAAMRKSAAVQNAAASNQTSASASASASASKAASAPVTKAASPLPAVQTVDLDAIFEKAADTYGVSPALLKSMAKAESGFNPNAVSSSGAQGIMQLMPGTAAALGVSDPLNPEQNIMGGAKYISDKIKQYNGDVTLALAAYQAGSGNVKKYGGVPPFKATKAYINKVLGNAKSALTAGTVVIDAAHAVTYGAVTPAAGAASASADESAAASKRAATGSPNVREASSPMPTFGSTGNAGSSSAASAAARPGSASAADSAARPDSASAADSAARPGSASAADSAARPDSDISELLDYYRAMIGAASPDLDSSLSAAVLAEISGTPALSGSGTGSVLSQLSGIGDSSGLSDLISNTDFYRLAGSGIMSDWLAATSLSEEEDNGFTDLINAYNKYNRMTINTVADAKDDEQDLL